MDTDADRCETAHVTTLHPLQRLHAAAGRPPPLDHRGDEIPPRGAGTVCAATGEPAPAYAYHDVLSANFVLPRFAARAFPHLRASRIELRGGRSEPALSRAAAWALRSLAFRSACYVLEPTTAGDRLEWCPTLPFPARSDHARLAAPFGGRTSADWLAWLLRPRPAGTLAALPAYGIAHGGESNFWRLPWPSGERANPLVKLQAKHTVLHLLPALRDGHLRLQVDSDLTIHLDTAAWRGALRDTLVAVFKIRAGLPEKARRWPIIRSIVEDGPVAASSPAAISAAADLHREHLALVRSPFWPYFVAGIPPQKDPT